jgi:hypothetical protein
MTTIAMCVLTSALLSVATPTSNYPHGKAYSLRDLPSAVQLAFDREASGGQVGDMHKETLDSRPVYQGEIVKDGKVTLLQVDAAGNVIHRGPTHDARTPNRPFLAVGR